MTACKKIIKWIFIFLLITNAALLLSGKFYYWKALIYNYVNIDDINLFPVRTVKTNAPKEWEFASDYNKNNISKKLLKELEDFKTVAFLIIRDDSIAYERYWDGYNDSSFSNSFSMAKSVIGILIGIAIDEGKIKSIDETVGNYIPAYSKGENSKLTIRHLLMMSSGLNWDESYSSLTSQTTEAYYGKKLFKQMSRLKVVNPPGKNFDYMSCNTQLLGIILRKATGKTISDYASEKLWTPLNSMHNAKWSLANKGGGEKAYCCLYSNARDFARIGKLYLDSGRWNGKQIVSENYVLTSVTPAPVLDNGQPNRIYGYQWWLDEIENHKIFYARGILGQYIIVIPERRIIIVRLGKQRDKTPDGVLNDFPIYIEEVLKMYP